MHRLSLLIIIAALLFSASLTSAQQRDGTQTDAQQGQTQNMSASPVSIARLSEQFHTISVVGRLEPKNRIVHHIPNNGYISSVSIKEGGFVEEGQQLFSIKRKDDVMNIYKPTLVTARITGWISKVFVQVDDEVEAAEPAVVIIGTEGYILDANISDKDAFKIRIGQRVTARTTGGVTINGVLANRSQEPDYSTGLFTLTFHFPNTQRTYVGEFVIIDLPIDKARGLFVRRDLVIRRYGKYFLWVVNEAGELTAREVVLGASYGELVKIDQGLEAGEHYLNRLTGREKEGAKIDRPGT
ncbi:MAG: HlyD family efflux transporter periplasmic adaptor subunit [Spirochaetota bacterium]|nr:MAG: HlyD family efflux transporter periplasmic adaptor subunit [Spirochaetota bacterium]